MTTPRLTDRLRSRLPAASQCSYRQPFRNTRVRAAHRCDAWLALTTRIRLKPPYWSQPRPRNPPLNLAFSAIRRSPRFTLGALPERLFVSNESKQHNRLFDTMLRTGTCPKSAFLSRSISLS